MSVHCLVSVGRPVRVFLPLGSPIARACGRSMLAAAAALGAGLLPGRAALKQCSGSVTRAAPQLQERAEPARTWASSYDLATEEVMIEAASSTAGPLEAYETAENPAQEGAVLAAEERSALILLPDASGWQGEGVRSLADRRAAPPQRAPPLPLPLPTPLPLQLTPHAPVPRQACHLLRLRRPAARPAALRAAVHRAARQRGVPGTPHVCTARMHCMCTARTQCMHALHACTAQTLRVHCACTARGTACALRVHCSCTAPALRLHCACTAPAPGVAERRARGAGGGRRAHLHRLPPGGPADQG